MKRLLYIVLLFPFALNGQIVDSALVNFTGAADTPEGWTNITAFAEGTYSLNDSDEEWSITFTYDQNGGGGTSNQGDQTASTYFPNWPTNVCSVYWYTTAADSFNLSIKGLDPNYSYTIHMMGNRSLTEVREQEMIINGTIDTMDVGDETEGCMGIIEDIYPDGDSIYITVKPITVGYAYINGIKIYEQDLNRSPLATPDAKGFGAYTKGGLGGVGDPTVLYVDRLTDDLSNNGVDHGSLRWCIAQTYPRIILFKVSGYIKLLETLYIESPYVSIYGQSAPDPGISIYNRFLAIGSTDSMAHDVIIQNIRFRGSSAYSNIFTYSGVKNVFIGNCSFSYSDGMTVFSNTSDSITVQDCIYSNTLNYNSGGSHSSSADNLSFIRNAFIHCAANSPYFYNSDVDKEEIVNNCVYDPNYWGIVLGFCTLGQEISIIGNKLKPGLSTNGGIGRQTVRLSSSFPTTDFPQIYLSENEAETRVGSSNWNGIVASVNEIDSTDVKVETPFSWATTGDWPVMSIEDSLFLYAGARSWKRDSVDILALNDLVDSTGERINLFSDAFWPELDSFYLSPPVPVDPWAVVGNGFTNFENWIYTYQGVSPDDPCASTLLQFNETITPSVNGAATGSITLDISGGLPPYSYDWDNDSTTSSISLLTPGDYTVIVTDDNTCTGEETFTVPIAGICDTTNIVITASITNEATDNAAGAIDITVSGGQTPYSFLWSNSETTEDLTDLSAEDYTVTVTDDNTCTGEETFTVINLKDYFLIVNNKIVIFDENVVIINK